MTPNALGSPLRCPDWERHPGDIVGCGSTNVEEDPDEPDMYDCLDCGMFFSLPEMEEAEQ